MGMDRAAELAERIKARAAERKEEARCKKYAITLEGTTNTLKGKTVSGKPVLFERCFGYSEQSKYGVGTLKVQEDGEWITIFTKGYTSKAFEYMSKH
jgi:hypothetical protein